MKLWIWITVLVCIARAAVVGAPIGYRGDGSCVEPKGNPPVTWDGRTGSNILWQAEMPSWGLGSPIAVGNRVYAMIEPNQDSDWPALVCFDGQTGKQLWCKPIDHVALMKLPADQEATVRKAWHDHLVALWTRHRMIGVWGSATNKTEALAILEQNGCTTNAQGHVTWKGDGTKRGERVDVKLAGTFNRYGLYFDVWHLSGMARIGYAYPTPVSDGERVYVATGLHAFACFNPDGTIVWQAFERGQDTSNAGYGGNDFCKNARSPLLYKDLFLSDVGNRVRAFDKKTGQLLWSYSTLAHEIVSPVIIQVQGQDYLLCGGPPLDKALGKRQPAPPAALAAYRLPDGQPIKVEGWSDHGGTMLVKSDERDVVFFTGGGEHGGWQHKGNPPCTNPPPAAVRFALVEGQLKATVLWSGINGKSSGECHTGLVYSDGKLYHKHGYILEALTGKVLRPSDRNRFTHHLLWLAGGRLYGMREDRPAGAKEGPTGGIGEIFDLTGKKLAENFLPVPKAEGERARRIGELGCGGFSYGHPFTIVGDRIYVRGNTVLYCIGQK